MRVIILCSLFLCACGPAVQATPRATDVPPVPTQPNPESFTPQPYPPPVLQASALAVEWTPSALVISWQGAGCVDLVRQGHAFPIACSFEDGPHRMELPGTGPHDVSARPQVGDQIVFEGEVVTVEALPRIVLPLVGR